MVRSLKKLLVGDHPPNTVIEISNDESKKMLAENGAKRHFEILSLADSSYSLKRGAGTSRFVYDKSNFNDNPLKSLISHLELALSHMLEKSVSNYSYSVIKCIQIDQTIRTSLRIINNRCAFLWRSDEESCFTQDSCLLYDDICLMIKNCGKFAISLKEYLVRKMEINSANMEVDPAMLPRLRSRKLLESTRAYKGAGFGLDFIMRAIYDQLINLVSYIFPSILIRVEKIVEFYLTNESKRIFSTCLKHDSFLGAPSRRMGNEKNRISSVLFGRLETKLRSTYTDAIREHCLFFSTIHIISTGLNAVLQSLLAFILHNKLRFSHEGVIDLYALITKVQNLIFDIKQELLGTDNCSFGDSSFNIVQDKDPWLRLNFILEILQTGRSSSTSSITNDIGGNTVGKTKVISKGYLFKLSAPISPEYTTNLLHLKPSRFSQLFNLFYRKDLAQILTSETEEQKGNGYNALASAIVPNKIFVPTIESNHETRMRRPLATLKGMDSIEDRVKSYRNSNRDVVNIKCRFILDSLRITYHHSRKNNMTSNMTEMEKTNWIALAAMRPNGTDANSCLPFASLYGPRKTTKLSSVSISVVVDINNL